MPTTLNIFVVSMASSNVSGGSIVGRRFASMVLPEPGGPTIIRLWPPAAATSKARLTCSWPMTSEKSISKSGLFLKIAEISVSRGFMRVNPRKNSTS